MKLKENINKNIFREYDLRGIYNEEIDIDDAYTIGKSFGTYIKKYNETETIIGHDNRHSSPELHEPEHEPDKDEYTSKDWERWCWQ